ncbi:MAG: uracil-DNA glycosylase [Atopococcus tabaci]|uniref:Uracil-DNA glycosylase n=1 Tax=Atopococcus tabaci TaxID=269774 RepID=A0AA43ZSJ7_9LACT|nr:uracil-DNA glycosylase [Atopococcus tabaci]
MEMIPVENDWRPILQEVMTSNSYQELREFLKLEYQKYQVFPDMHEIWTAFQWTSFSDTKVVILGQDPYHGLDQAHGLSFSVQPGVKVPPSLKNIYKELEDDLGYSPVTHGYLKKWADQGVLLLNTVLTVRAGQAHSHKNKGWEKLTDHVIQSLNQKEKPIVFILWGNASIQKRELIDESKHIVLTSSHPSPFSARISFFGSKPFSRTNEVLKESGQDEIDWQLPKEVQE